MKEYHYNDRCKIHLYNQDCMEALECMPDNSYDLAIVDPPYFNGPQKLGFYGGRCSKIGVSRNGYKKIGVWDKPDPEYFKHLKRVSGDQIIWGINYYQIENLGPGRIVWDKCNTASTFSDCEIAYCSSIESVRKFTFMWNGMLQGNPLSGSRMQGNKKLNEKRIHPTQKPVELYKWLLKNYVQEGAKILDTHLGSGGIAIACHDLQFDLTGLEIDKNYFQAAVNRFQNHSDQGMLF